MRLFTPGPTPLIPEAQLVMAEPLIHHRTEEFKELVLDTLRNLRAIFRTKHEIVILTSSGTGAMEAAVSNLHQPGDRVVAVVAGKFGERWIELTNAFGIKCIRITKEYGEAASAAEILDVLRNNPGVSSLLLQACETSTGTSHDLESIGKAVSQEFPDILIIVDGISAIGSQPIEPDAWGLDIVIGGSQKAFGVVPGLAILSISPKAVKVLQTKEPCAHYYLNLRKELQGQASGTTGYTPAITSIKSLRESTNQILRQGLDSVISEAELMARSARKGLSKLGFRMLSLAPANSVTAAFPPSGIEADFLRNSLEKDYGLKVAGGQGPLRGKIIRIAHLGYFDLLDVVTVLSAIELCLTDKGIRVGVGAGVKAALQEIRRSRET
jgi:aspartate aminotransferase-like enzyme